MKNGFEIKGDGSIPVVYVDGEPLSVVSLVYKWHTMTDKVEDGVNMCIVEGFLKDDILPKRIVFDLSKRKEP